MGKRQKQVVAMAKKAEQEDQYFRQCQREAAQQRGGGGNLSRSETELFQKQVRTKTWQPFVGGLCAAWPMRC